MESSSALARRRRGAWGSSLPRLGIVLLLGLGGLQVLLPRLGLRGDVRDAQSGTPLAGVTVRAPGEVVRTDPDGTFQLGLVPPWKTVAFEVEGYQPHTTAIWPGGQITVVLTPLAVELRVLHADTGEPLRTQVETDFGRIETLEPGRFRISPAREGLRATAHAEGFLPASAVYRADAPLELRLTPLRIGRVVDARSGAPVPGALILADEQLLRSDENGSYALPARPRRPLRATAPGYRRLEVDTTAAGSLELRLEPFVARGLYLSFYGIGDEGLRGHALRLLENTEINTLVIDVKGDRGYLVYPSRVPLAEKIGATGQHTIPNIEALLAELHAKNYYVIARIVVFKDDLLARNGAEAGLDVAIKDRHTGKVWVDGEGLGWVDPFRSEAWEYNVALAREAAERGFDEIQFDYVRFPTDPSNATSVDSATYSREPTAQSRPEAIASLLRMTHQALQPLGAYLSIDTFGYACFRDDDMGIGQHLPTLAPHVDYISPMIYPSTYNAGLPGAIGYPTVVDRPYEVVHASLEQARSRLAGHRAVLRPWLQYFDDYPWATQRAYNAVEIEAQKKATADAGGSGWLMWDPANRYGRGGFAPR